MLITCKQVLLSHTQQSSVSSSLFSSSLYVVNYATGAIGEVVVDIVVHHNMTIAARSRQQCSNVSAQ